MELKVKALEEALILYRQQINDFANDRETEHVILEEQENIQLEENGKVDEHRKNTMKILKDIGLSPIKIAQSQERLNPRKTKHKTQPNKTEMKESSESEEDEPSSNFKTSNKSTSRFYIVSFEAGDPIMNGTKSGNEGTSSRFTATPSKFDMKTYDPKDTNFLDHLARLEMGLKQSEEKGCTLNTRQNLILMTLPAEYTYVTQFVNEHKNDLDTFRKKLVELIIGSNTDQTNPFHDNSHAMMNASNHRRNQSRNSDGARNEFQQRRNNISKSNTFHRNQSGNNEMTRNRCFYCGQTGHKKRQCYRKQYNKRKDNETTNNSQPNNHNGNQNFHERNNATPEESKPHGRRAI